MAPDLLAAADAVRNASVPTAQQGSMLLPRPVGGNFGSAGLNVNEAQWQIIADPELRWPFSNRVYEAMRREAQIQGLLASVFLPVRHMEWYVDPKGTTGTIAEEIAEDLGLPLLGDTRGDVGPGIDFDEHLRLALLALAFGHQFFEQGYELVGEGNGMRWRLRELRQCPPTSIQRIDVDPGGPLVSIRTPSRSPATDGPYVDLPAEHLLAYCWDKEGANWAGRPLLYGIHRNWLLKYELIGADVSTKRRFGGIPVTSATNDDVDDKQAALAALMAQRLQSGDGSGVFMPYGTDIKLLGVQGSVPDAIASARYHDEQMARAFMQMFAELGKTQSGSRALGTTLLDHYALGVLAVAKWARKTLMTQLVARVAAWNYGSDVVLPTVGFRQDDHEDITMQELVGLIDAGAITVDDELEATIRDRSNLPPRDLTQPARVLPGATPPALPAPAAARHKHGRRPASAAAGDTTPDLESLADYAALQAAYLDAVTRLGEQWADVTAQQIDELVAKVEQAGNVIELAAITPTILGHDLLVTELTTVMEHGAETAVADAAAQGRLLPAADLAAARAMVEAHAAGTAGLIARALGESAASKAVALTAEGTPAADVAAGVRAHLEGLAGATRDYELAGAVTRAQNTGRFTVMEQAPQGTRFYASEINDTNTCSACTAEDGTEFASIAEGRSDYPAGYLGCEGGNRCRGTIVAVYTEA